MIELSRFSPRKLAFAWNADVQGFTHNFLSDAHGVAIWERGRSEQDLIVSELRRCFRILAGYEVVWSAEHVADNFNRLYGRLPGGPSSRHEWAGSGPFLYFVISDQRPRYLFRQNLSGRVELTSQPIADFKKWARSKYDKRLPHVIHSSNHIGEFMKDAALILGEEEMRRVISLFSRPTDWDGSLILLEKDLEGSAGWKSLDHFFSVLALTQRWTLLRPSGQLLSGNFDSGTDIDILTERAAEFAAFANAFPRLPGRAGPTYFTKVGSSQVPIDLREPGDFDLDPGWQRQLLSSYSDVTPPHLPASEQFFYLAYHCIFHKGIVKEQHAATLGHLAKQIGLELHSPKDVLEKPSKELKEIVSGYLIANGFRVSDPAPLGLSLEPSGDWNEVAPMTMVSQNVTIPYKLPRHSANRYLVHLSLGAKRRITRSKSFRFLRKKLIRSFRFVRWLVFRRQDTNFKFGFKLIEVNSHEGRFRARVAGKMRVPVNRLSGARIDWQAPNPLRKYQTSIYGSPHFLFALDIVRGNNSLRGRESYMAYKTLEHNLSPKEAVELADRFENSVLALQGRLTDQDFGDLEILVTVEGLSKFRVNDGVHRLAAAAAISDSTKVSTLVRI